MNLSGLTRYLQAVDAALEVYQVARLHLLRLPYDGRLSNDALNFPILALLLGSGLCALCRKLGGRFEAKRGRLA